MSTTNQSKKYLSVITYCIALVCLLLGLFLPLYNGEGLLFMALPNAVCTMLGLEPTDLGEALSRTYPVIFTGTETSVDFIAVTVSVYALITAIGVIMLIPVLASKSTSKTANVCAYIIEIAAAVVLFVYTVLEIMLYSMSGYPADFKWDYGVIAIAFGGTLLMLIIQSFGYKKGSGVMKFIVAILGAAAVLCLFDFASLVKLDTHSVFDDKVGISFVGLLVYGISVMHMLLTGGLDVTTASLFASDEVTAKIGTIALACTALIVLVNFALDIMAVGATTKKGTLVVDIIRYAIETAFAILAVVMVFVVKSELGDPGLLLYVVLGIAVIQVIISAVRCAVFKPAAQTENNAESFTTYYDDTAIPAAAAPAPGQAYAPQQPAAYVQPVYLQPVYQQAPAAAPAPAPAVQSGEVVYTAKEVYHGPTDSFIARLTDSEKIEFAKLFLEKINGSYANLPDYVVGGDNKEFFSSIFVYLGKFRSIISDGLMNKIYNELNLLN